MRSRASDVLPHFGVLLTKVAELVRKEVVQLEEGGMDWPIVWGLHLQPGGGMWCSAFSLAPDGSFMRILVEVAELGKDTAESSMKKLLGMYAVWQRVAKLAGVEVGQLDLAEVLDKYGLEVPEIAVSSPLREEVRNGAQ